MARLVGYFGNQADRLRCALALDGEGVAFGDRFRPEGWGVGSFQGGEILLRRKPIEHRDRVEFQDLVRDLRTDCAIVHARDGGAIASTLENTQPFRFRQWLFAHAGHIPELDSLRPAIMERIPDFLLRNVRGETDSELIFHLFLGFVHAAGGLDDSELDRRAIASALQQTVLALDDITTRAGRPPAVLNCVVTNHHAMVALRRGAPMVWIRRHGVRDCAVCRRQPDIAGREPKRVDHEQFKYVLIATGYPTLPHGWYELPEAPRGTVLAIDNLMDAQVGEL